MAIFQISGGVINRQTHCGIPGLRIEAWDKDLICDDLVGSALTDEQGHFQIEFDESYFQELFWEHVRFAHQSFALTPSPSPKIGRRG